MTMSALPPSVQCLSGGTKVAASEGNHHLMCFPSDGGRWVQGEAGDVSCQRVGREALAGM